MDYRETDHPPERFVPAYAMARAAGLKTTAHAGEFGCPWQHVQTALDQLQVDRLDHGYTLLQNPALARRVADSGIIVTVVPTNSYYLRMLPPDRWAAEHPIRFMPAAGVRVHPNTDDLNPAFGDRDAAAIAVATAIPLAYLTLYGRKRAIARMGQTRSGLVEDLLIVAAGAAVVLLGAKPRQV